MSTGRVLPYGLRAGRVSDGGNAGAKIAISSTAAVTALITIGSGGTLRYPTCIHLNATVPCLIRFTSGATAVATNKFDHYIAANVPYVIDVPNLETKIDVITEPTSGTGSLYYSVLGWSSVVA